MVSNKFTGTKEELISKLDPLKGKLDASHPGKLIIRVGKGVLSWFETTGTIQFQGKHPDSEHLKNEVLHLLYPSEFSSPKKHEVMQELANHPNDATNQENASDSLEIKNKKESLEVMYLKGAFYETELMIGIVSAVGTENKRVLDPLIDQLKGFGYRVVSIKLSDLLLKPSKPASEVKEYDRIKHCMDAGDKFRKEANNNAILAAGAAHKIKDSRDSNDDQVNCKKIAYIIDSLKHPDEVDFLRRVYKEGFYLFGIHAEEKRRREYLTSIKHLSQSEASELIKIDEDENIDYGQRTRDTFHLSDFFINLGKDDDEVKSAIRRFLEIIFSNPFNGPTFDEFAMFMAFNSSIRSSDLSRQVGAIIARNQQIIATGANDTPKFGGGQYWAEKDKKTGKISDFKDGKDYTREQDSNKMAQKEIIKNIAELLVDEKVVQESQRGAIEEILKRSKISDLTEFGRVVHAEMEAILSCSRVGIETVDAELYCTTFPCHNCAKHIIDSGIRRVVYVEPYPKSRALDLHSEAITLGINNDDSLNSNRVVFEPFTGVGARRFLDLFSMSLGNGAKIKRKNKEGKTVDWIKEGAMARTPLLPKSYLEVESAASEIWQSISNKIP